MLGKPEYIHPKWKWRGLVAALIAAILGLIWGVLTVVENWPG